MTDTTRSRHVSLTLTLTLTLPLMSLDLRWNLILQKQDSDLRFALNAVQDSLPTPSRLKHSQQNSAGDGLCPLGCRSGSLLHILWQFQKAVKEELQSRITWRHDSALLAVYKGFKDQIKQAVEPRVEARMKDSTSFNGIPTKRRCSLFLTTTVSQGATTPLCDCCCLWTGPSS